MRNSGLLAGTGDIESGEIPRRSRLIHNRPVRKTFLQSAQIRLPPVILSQEAGQAQERFHPPKTILETLDILRPVHRSANHRATGSIQKYIPFWRIALFLDGGENTFGLIINAMRTLGHLSVAFNLLLATHITSLQNQPISQSTLLKPQ